MKAALRWAALMLLCCTVGQLVSAESKYLGCFKDVFPAADRDLGGMVALEETRTTPALCEDICGRRHQFKYFGLQYGQECWCGNSYGKHGEESASMCNKPCAGDTSQKCGGEFTNSVYEITTTYTPPPPHADGRPLLGLVMIVRNESHTLPATLLAIKPWIDVYYILDTGSSDGTQDAIRRTLGADKGEVWEEPFIDYGRSRNRALEIASQSTRLGGPPIFSLMLSADETVTNGESLRRFCEEHRDLAGSTEEAYYVQMDVGWRFDSARLSRTDKKWRYVGRVHEYLASPTGRGAPAHRVPNTYIRFKATDLDRRSSSQYTILRILQEEVVEKPRDTRASFYLARTYNVVGNHSASLAEFYRRVSLGGWKEEVYESLYAIGWQKESLGLPWHEIQQAFLDAHAHSPERAEPLYAVASHWYRAKNPALAYLFASHGATLPYPAKATLWVQADVYAWQCHMIVGMTGLDVGKPEEGARGLIKALTKRARDQPMQQQAVKYRALLGAEKWEALECEIDPAHCRSKQANRPSDPPVDMLPPVNPSSHPSARPAGLYSPLPIPAHTPEQVAAEEALIHANDPWYVRVSVLWFLVVLLVAANAVQALTSRKGRAGPPSCVPSIMMPSGRGGDKQV